MVILLQFGCGVVNTGDFHIFHRYLEQKKKLNYVLLILLTKLF